MDFTFSADQDALRDTVRGFLANEASDGYVRAMADDERGFTDDMWQRMAEMGWPGLLVPETHGGLGLGLVDMVVVMEEMGRLPFPGPFFSSAVLATLAPGISTPTSSCPRSHRARCAGRSRSRSRATAIRSTGCAREHAARGPAGS